MGSRFRFDGETVLVAGAGLGIGASTTRTLAALGARVLCVDRDLAAAEAIAAEVDGQALAADITDEAEVEALADRVGSLFGLVDIVGGALMKRLPELTLGDWESQMTLNLRHAFLLGRHVGPQVARGGGMVFLSSAAAVYGGPAHPAYGAAKAGLVGWVRSMAHEFGDGGVRVNAVAPGSTLTPRVAEVWGEEGRETRARRSLLNRVNEPRDIAGAIAFLLSRAAAGVTGQLLVVDGGTTIRDPHYR